jgi:hypothetical protein
VASIWLTNVCAQTSEESQNFLTETLSQTNLDKEELLSKLIGFDYSFLWAKNDTVIYGYIGDNYQRLNIKYLVIIKNDENHSKYYIYGKSKVKSNVCQFIGEIELIHIRKISDPEKQQLYEEAKRQNDEEAIKRFSKQAFILLGKYQFYEDPNQKETGIFKGILRTNFYVDGGKVFYDDLEIESDNFYNNQFVGIWINYRDGITKRCNWGEYRIPYSGNFDIGVGEFCPNEKYLNNGWNIYYKAFIQNDKNARKMEALRWW